VRAVAFSPEEGLLDRDDGRLLIVIDRADAEQRTAAGKILVRRPPPAACSRSAAAGWPNLP
jgi:hypothetical protein